MVIGNFTTGMVFLSLLANMNKANPWVYGMSFNVERKKYSNATKTLSSCGKRSRVFFLW